MVDNKGFIVCSHVKRSLYILLYIICMYLKMIFSLRGEKKIESYKLYRFPIKPFFTR